MAIPQELTEEETKQLIQLVRKTQFDYKLSQYEDEALKEINKSTLKARQEISQKLKTINPESTFTKERLEALSEELQDLTVASQAQITGEIIQVATTAGAASYAEHNDILSFGGLVPNFNPVTLSAAQLYSMVVETPIGGKLLSEWVSDTFSNALQETIKLEIMTGMLKGEGYRELVKRFDDVAFPMFERNVETLTRSYVQSVNVQAMEDVAKANADIVKGQKWSSVCENRTCMICMSLDAKNKVYPIGEGPTMPAHPRCRCIWEIITKTFREMGVDINEIEEAYRPYTIRGTVDPITGKVSPGKIGVGGGKVIGTGRFLGDYDSFFKGLSPAVQTQMLGPGRYDLWKSGAIKLSDLTDAAGNLKLLKEL